MAEEPKVDEQEQEATGHETMKAIRGVMDKHKGEAHADGPHDAYFNLDTGNVFHHHHKDASAEHLSLCKDDMENADGVASVEQGTEAPTDKAYVKVFGGGEDNKPEEEPVGKQGVATVTKKKKPNKSSREDEFWRRYQGALDETGDSSQAYAIVANEMGKRGKLKAEYTRKAQLAFHVGRGKAVMAMKRLLPKKQKDALEECVHRKIPKIAEDHPEVSDDQRTAMAFSMCAESKAFGHDAYTNKEETEQPGGATTEEYAPGIPADPEDNKQPPSLTLCQQAIENIEAALPGLEPETREFWEDILQQCRDHGTQRYPQESFGGEETKDEPTTEESREFANEVTDAYRETPEQREERESKEKLQNEQEAEKRAQIQYRKSMRILRKGDHPEILRGSADHLHNLGDMTIGKTLSKTDKSMCKEHARALDRLHGAVTAYMKKDEEEEPDEREMEQATGTTDNPVPEAPDPEGTDDEAPAEVEKLFAAVVDKAVNGDGATAQVLKGIDAMSERLANIFGTRF